MIFPESSAKENVNIKKIFFDLIGMVKKRYGGNTEIRIPNTPKYVNIKPDTSNPKSYA